MTIKELFTPKRLTIWLILAVIGFFTGTWFNHVAHKEGNAVPQTPYNPEKILGNLAAATVLSDPKALSPFNFLDTKSQPFNNKSFIGHWTILYFGFTRCPSICPTTMTLLNKVYQQLQTDKKTSPPEIVFVTVDPERDTLVKLQQFISSFNPNFKGVRGDKKQINQLTNELSVLYFHTQPVDPKKEDYQIDHSGSLILINPIGEFYGIFSTPLDAQRITQDLEMITSNG